MTNNSKNSNTEKSHKNHLRKNSQSGSLKKALASPQANQRVPRQIKGGKVDTTQPPHVSGFFVPVNLSGDDTSLPRGYGIKKRSRVNTCGGVPLSHLGTRGSFKTVSANTLDNIKELTAMNATTHGTATPVAAIQGVSPHSCSCKLLSSVLSDAITKAKTEAATGGKFGTANAYAELLQKFHAAILPGFISETKGNTSQLARLLGLDRSTVQSYAKSAGLDHLIGRQGVKS